MSGKPISLSGHAREQAAYRGASEDEIRETILGQAWGLTGHGRNECRKDFVFGGVWNGKTYATKQVHPIFVEEPNEIAVVTVYVYYF